MLSTPFRRWALSHFDRCQWCNKPLTMATATTDHLLPRSKGGTNAPSNLCLACGPCNVARGNSGNRFSKPKFGPNWGDVWSGQGEIAVDEVQDTKPVKKKDREKPNENDFVRYSLWVKPTGSGWQHRYQQPIYKEHRKRGKSKWLPEYHENCSAGDRLLVQLHLINEFEKIRQREYPNDKSIVYRVCVGEETP